MPLYVCKSVYGHYQSIAASLFRAQVVAIWTEDGAHGKGIGRLRSWLMEAWQMRETAAEPFGSAQQCFLCLVELFRMI